MSIISREFRHSDIDAIDEIYKRQPNLGVPSLRNVIVNSTLVDTESGKIIGYGCVKVFAEATLILDKSISKKLRSRAVIEAMNTAITFCKARGLEILYAIAVDKNFGKVLENRWIFKRVPGALYCRDLTINED